ncbi:MAG: radical SAM protein [Acidobacteriota bacterium]|nr:radical SAM protein [Acidobacteriota bacterium]
MSNPPLAGTADLARPRFTCDWIFNILVVLSDGRVVCGCADPRGERPLGSLAESSLLEIWRSDRVREIRRGLNEGYAPFCLPCGLKRALPAGAPAPQRPVDLETPPRIFLEPTVGCNLSCLEAVCAKESGIIATRSRPFFPLDEFRRVMDEVGPGLVRLDLFNYGEPFVHPQAVAMIEYVKERFPRVYLYISTNGLLLDEAGMKRLIAAGLDEITFSVDGPDQKTYEKYRRGGDLAKALEVMKTLVRLRNEAGREVPFINWRYILFNWNDRPGQMARARRLAKRIGVDRFNWEITDHPPAAKSVRYQPGTRGWRRIRCEIWDTSQIGSALRGGRYEGRIKPAAGIIRMAGSSPAALAVRVKNTGGRTWPVATSSGRRLVRLGAQLHDAEKRLLDRDFARAFLPRDVRGGESLEMTIEIPPPPSLGAYFLKFDLVSEGIDWFENGGSPIAWRELIVGPVRSADHPEGEGHD